MFDWLFGIWLFDQLALLGLGLRQLVVRLLMLVWVEWVSWFLAMRVGMRFMVAVLRIRRFNSVVMVRYEIYVVV